MGDRTYQDAEGEARLPEITYFYDTSTAGAPGTPSLRGGGSISGSALRARSATARSAARSAASIAARSPLPRPLPTPPAASSCASPLASVLLPCSWPRKRTTVQLTRLSLNGWSMACTSNRRSRMFKSVGGGPSFPAAFHVLVRPYSHERRSREVVQRRGVEKAWGCLSPCGAYTSWVKKTGMTVGECNASHKMTGICQ